MLALVLFAMGCELKPTEPEQGASKARYQVSSLNAENNQTIAAYLFVDAEGWGRTDVDTLVDKQDKMSSFLVWKPGYYAQSQLVDRSRDATYRLPLVPKIEFPEVPPQNRAPVARLKIVGDDYSDRLPATFSFDDAGSTDEDGDPIVVRELMAPNGGTFANLPASITFTSPGTKKISYRVKDSRGAWSGETFATVTIDTVKPRIIVVTDSVRVDTLTIVRTDTIFDQNRAPVARLKIVGDDYSDRLPATFSFDDAGSTDEDGDPIVVRELMAPNGGTFANLPASITFTSPGTKKISYRVKDSRGAWSGETFATVTIDTVSRGRIKQTLDIRFRGTKYVTGNNRKEQVILEEITLPQNIVGDVTVSIRNKLTGPSQPAKENFALGFIFNGDTTFTQIVYDDDTVIESWRFSFVDNVSLSGPVQVIAVHAHRIPGYQGPPPGNDSVHFSEDSNLPERWGLIRFEYVVQR